MFDEHPKHVIFDQHGNPVISLSDSAIMRIDEQLFDGDFRAQALEHNLLTTAALVGVVKVRVCADGVTHWQLVE